MTAQDWILLHNGKQTSASLENAADKMLIAPSDLHTLFVHAIPQMVTAKPSLLSTVDLMMVQGRSVFQ